MKNIQTVHPNEMEDFFASFWKSQEFKQLQKNNPYFKVWLNKLKEAPIFFFDLSHEKGKYHLTSHLRLIARREYSNNYMNDLYYMHELTHCAEFEASEDIDYTNWKNKLNDNELYASIVSEVFVYYFCPSMIGKTFNPLWAKRFYDKDVVNPEYHKDSFGFFIKDSEIGYKENSDFSFLNFKSPELWPESIQNIIYRRKKLRALINSDNLGADEATIIEYNIPRYKWIEKWKPHYLNIDRLLMSLKSGKMNSEEYLNAMFGNCDEFYRPFFPK